jgi:hypothetical protein
MTDKDLYDRKQEFIGFLKTMLNDVNYTIKKSGSPWTVSAIVAAEELLGALRYYEVELTHYRDSLQDGLDKLSEPVYDEYLMEEEVA